MDIIFEQTFKTIKELAPRYFYQSINIRYGYLCLNKTGKDNEFKFSTMLEVSKKSVIFVCFKYSTNKIIIGLYTYKVFKNIG